MNSCIFLLLATVFSQSMAFNHNVKAGDYDIQSICLRYTYSAIDDTVPHECTLWNHHITGSDEDHFVSFLARTSLKRARGFSNKVLMVFEDAAYIVYPKTGTKYHLGTPVNKKAFMLSCTGLFFIIDSTLHLTVYNFNDAKTHESTKIHLHTLTEDKYNVVNDRFVVNMERRNPDFLTRLQRMNSFYESITNVAIKEINTEERTIDIMIDETKYTWHY